MTASRADLDGIIEREARLTHEQAERALHATLGERLSGGEARDLDGWLPHELRPPVRPTPAAPRSALTD